MQGIQTAANFYFDKDVSQLTIAEAACLVAITKSPKYNNPIDYPENNKARQQYILGEIVITSYSIHYTKLYDCRKGWLCKITYLSLFET